jgi:hypothetical protein
MVRMDLDKIRETYLVFCGPCDTGYLTSCTCPPDPRNVIDQMTRHLESIYSNYELLLASTMSDAVDELDLLKECQTALRSIRALAVEGHVSPGELAKLIPPRLLGNGA